MRSVVVGCGSYLPQRVMDNDELAKLVDTNDEWITERTGIKTRHIAADGELTSDLAVEASKKALEAADCDADEIDMIILATTTPDNTFPSTATHVQAKLGMTTGAAFDIQAVCTGFIYAMSVADNFIKVGQCKKVLVIGAETFTRILDWEDRGTCILFGDGAGAVVLEGQEHTDRGILSSHLYSDGRTRELLYTDGGVSFNGEVGKVRMEGKEIFKHAVQKMVDCTNEALEVNNLTVDDIDWIVPHQANIRILDSTIKKMKVSKDKLIATVDQHANTSAASIPLALDVAIRDGRIKQGNLVALQAIGGGLTWGSCLVRW